MVRPTDQEMTATEKLDCYSSHEERHATQVGATPEASGGRGRQGTTWVRTSLWFLQQGASKAERTGLGQAAVNDFHGVCHP